MVKKTVARPIVRVDFVADDVVAVRSDIEDVSTAEDFLHENRKYIEEAMCAAGFEAIETLWFTKLPAPGC